MSVLKKEAKIKAAFEAADKCGTCLHFQNMPYPGARKSCDKLGHLASSPKCELYNPNIAILADKSPSVVKLIGKIAQKFNRSELQLLGHLMYAADTTRREGWYIGQPVWFCIGQDYLTNYFQGYVLRANAEFVFITAELSQGAGGTYVQVMKKSTLDEEQFLKVRRQLVKAGRVTEPRKNGNPTLFEELQMTKAEFVARREALVSAPSDYEPPTLDTVPQHWLDKRHAISFKADASKASVVEKHIKQQAAIRSSKKGVKGGKFVVNRNA